MYKQYTIFVYTLKFVVFWYDIRTKAILVQVSYFNQTFKYDQSQLHTVDKLTYKLIFERLSNCLESHFFRECLYFTREYQFTPCLDDRVKTSIWTVDHINKTNVIFREFAYKILLWNFRFQENVPNYRKKKERS